MLNVTEIHLYVKVRPCPSFNGWCMSSFGISYKYSTRQIRPILQNLAALFLKKIRKLNEQIVKEMELLKDYFNYSNWPPRPEKNSAQTWICDTVVDHYSPRSSVFTGFQ